MKRTFVLFYAACCLNSINVDSVWRNCSTIMQMQTRIHVEFPTSVSSKTKHRPKNVSHLFFPCFLPFVSRLFYFSRENQVKLYRCNCRLFDCLYISQKYWKTSECGIEYMNWRYFCRAFDSSYRIYRVDRITNPHETSVLSELLKTEIS